MTEEIIIPQHITFLVEIYGINFTVSERCNLTKITLTKYNTCQWYEEGNCCNLSKVFWMSNDQNSGWKWNGNLYSINKIQYLPAQQSEEVVHHC